MQLRALLALALLFGIGFVIWVVITVVIAAVSGAKSVFKKIDEDIKSNRRRKEDQRNQAAISAQKKQIEKMRNNHPAEIVGAPNLTLLKQISTQLDEFVATVKSYRPQIQPYDHRFRSVSFSYPFEFFFPRKNCSDDGPDPETWETTLDSLAIKTGRPLRQIYNGLSAAAEFPVKEPFIGFDQKPLPRLQIVQLPSWSIKIINRQTGGEISTQSDILAKAYAPEVEEVGALRRTADELRTVIGKKIEEAREEQELMELHIANQRLKAKELKQSISAEFRTCKKQFEERAAHELRPIRGVYKAYFLETQEGIEQHFSLGLETIQLPIPLQFPWRVFYDRDERLIQINQRVPFATDTVVKRPDTNRPVAKRDIDEFLRRLVPSISLHIAANVAANDWHDHVDTIAVNCWCRYFEKATGKLKDAFVSSLKAEKKAILEMNISKADALDAFRALRGTFVYSTVEIVPIEPQIRLDKTDKRFIEGKEILDGMAQGQNLATMDWQEFEHLIRELLAKEYGKEGSDVRITRASRDRGVDAVVFDPDPLHGGKYVVQAKRYNNVVDVSAVRDLYGTMLNEGAARGILVTTSKYGRDAFDFASNKPITLIDGQNLLSLLAKHGYQFKIQLA